MTYRVQKKQNRYHVIEKDTGFVISQGNNEKEIRQLCRSLNLGSGFNGYTPAFFLQKFKQKERPSTE